MRRFLACATALLTVVVWIAPASAAPRSPRPTATLTSTGTITTEWGEEAFIEVNARDVDGMITEIEVYWGDGAVSFAHSYPCLMPPTPDPGDDHRFLVSNEYAEPGRYTVRYVVYSTTGCDADSVQQHSRPYTVRLTAP